MDEVTCVKLKYRKDQWVQLIRECQSSGMLVNDWCNANNISKHAYYYWLRKIRLGLCEVLPATVAAPDKPVSFTKLEVKPPVDNTRAAVIIRLPQATLEISEGTSQQTVQAVLLALQSIC